MMETQTESVVKVETSTGEFCRALRNALVVASKDACRPALCAVRVEGKGETIEVVSTDSYRLLRQTVTWPTCLEFVGSASITLEGSAIASMLGVVKALKTPDTAPCVVEFTAERFTVRGGIEWTSEALPLDYPNWRQLWPDLASLTPCTSFVLNVGMLADMSKVFPFVESPAKRKERGVEFYTAAKHSGTNALGPIVADLGGGVEWLQMPIRK